MKDIEVGEYVRTENGIIDKVDSLCGMIENTVYLKQQSLWFNMDCIVNHSKQLIDLIEFGDIVNGIKVIYKGLGKNNNVVSFDNGHDEVKLKDIKTILTKEIYMANCYKVGGEDESTR